MALKTSRCRHPSISKTVWGNIRKIQYMRDISDDNLALMLECSTKTLRNYDNKPECITLKTLQLFCINAEVGMAELIV